MKDLSSYSSEDSEKHMIECSENKLDSELLRASEELFSKFEEDDCEEGFQEIELIPNRKSKKWFCVYNILFYIFLKFG